MRKRIATYFLGLVLVFSFTLGFSFLYPGNVLPLDILRLKIQTPIIQYLSSFQIRAAYTSDKPFNGQSIDITYDELASYLRELKPASIFFTSSHGFAGSAFIRGEWKHAAIFLGNKEQVVKSFGDKSKIYLFLTSYYKTGNEVLILDSSCKGVLVRQFNELSNLHSKSFLRALVCYEIQISEANKQRFLEIALSYVGKEFDYDFKINDDSSFYCSELVCKCLNTIGINIDKRGDLCGRTFVSPTNLVTYIRGEGIAKNQFALHLFLMKDNGILKTNFVDGERYP